MNRILIVRLGSLGDIVHAVPAAAAVMRAWPSAAVDWVTAPGYRELVGMVRGLRRVITLDTRRVTGPDGILATLRTLRASRYDAVLDLQGLLKSAVLARLAGGARTLGFSRADLREPLAATCYGETVDVSAATHVIDKGLALVRALGGPAHASGASPAFPLDVPEVPAVQTLAARTAPGGYALLNPGAAWPNKQWPVERFGAVAQALRRERGLPSVVLWGPGEHARAEAVVAASAGAAELAPPATIPGIAALAKQARLVVSGDTGPLHLAAAVGAPAVALFGPTRAERNGPWSADDVSISRFADCQCAYQRRCTRDVPCLHGIETAEVVGAAALRLDRAARTVR
ncbi:MAG: lipopolysaccharide heptosyltransferase I [Vicinamibacterales bacterium]